MYPRRRPRTDWRTPRWWVCLLWLALSTARIAHAEDVKPELEIAIQMNVLSFDRALKDRLTGDTLTIAVLHTDGSGNLPEVLQAFAQVAKKRTVHGKHIRAISVAMTTDFAARMPDSIAAIYVTSGATNEQLAAIAKLAQVRSLPTGCGNRAYLDHGIAVSVVSKSSKPAIVVHAGNAKRSGMALDARFLRLTEVVH